MKSKRKNKKVPSSKIADNVLPQNILSIGGRVEADKNIYISQPVYKEIHKFTKNKTTDESGGILVGTLIEEFGKKNIVISGFVEAKYCEATPTTLTFTHETWEHVHKEIEKKHKGKKILGWIHTHPDFGIFLSEYDKFIHQNFFNEDSQVAYVIDPIQNIEGFYFWNNGNLEKCSGFYIFDKTGARITVDPEKDNSSEGSDSALSGMKNILIAILTAAVVLLTFSNISTNKKLETLETQQANIIYDINQLYQQILWDQSTVGMLQTELADLKTELTANGVIAAPTEPAVSDLIIDEIPVEDTPTEPPAQSIEPETTQTPNEGETGNE